jgi:hypothetical protein
MWLVSRPPAFVTLAVVWALQWRYILKQMKARREMRERQEKGLTASIDTPAPPRSPSAWLTQTSGGASNCGAFTPRLFRRQKFVQRVSRKIGRQAPKISTLIASRGDQQLVWCSRK